MSSFIQKLATKLNETGTPESDPQPVKVVASESNGVHAPATAQPQQGNGPAGTAVGQPAVDPIPDGVQSAAIDLYQSTERMVLFVPMSGIAMEGLDLVADEESNTLLIQAVQKRPEMPPLPGAAKDAPAEKGRFVKQEAAWASLYRKVYLPAPFDLTETEAFLVKGVLVVVLPVKQPGVGKKLAVKEIFDEPKADVKQAA